MDDDRDSNWENDSEPDEDVLVMDENELADADKFTDDEEEQKGKVDPAA